LRHSNFHLLSACLATLFAQFVGLLLGRVQLPGHGRQVPLYCGHRLHFPIVSHKISQRLLDVLVYVIGERRMRLCYGLGGRYYLLPRRIKYAVSRSVCIYTWLAEQTVPHIAPDIL
jgi:hypothetical protein